MHLQYLLTTPRHREKTKRELKSFENAHCVHHCTIRVLLVYSFSRSVKSRSPLIWQMVKASWIVT